MSKAVQVWRTKVPNSWNVPSWKRRISRSRADSSPFSCRSRIFFSPPPASTCLCLSLSVLRLLELRGMASLTLLRKTCGLAIEYAV